MDKAELERVLERHWKELRERANVINVGVGTKIVGGKDTGKPCITVFVRKKIPRSYLARKALIPGEVEGVPTDVVELSTEDYELGETEVSRRPPSEQRRIAGGVRR